MITFFRRVRQRLLSDKKLDRYLLYTIGEVMLIVIGILIALAINSRIDQNKKQEATIVILEALREDIKSDLHDLEHYWTPRFNEQTDARDRLEAFIENSLDIMDTAQFVTDLMLISVYHTFDHNRTAMDDLINTGKLELVKDQEFRQALLDYKSDVENIAEFDLVHRSYFLELYGRLITKVVDGFALPRSFQVYHDLDTLNSRYWANSTLNAQDIRSSNYLMEFLVASSHPFYTQKYNYIALESKAKELLSLLNEELAVKN